MGRPDLPEQQGQLGPWGRLGLPELPAQSVLREPPGRQDRLERPERLERRGHRVQLDQTVLLDPQEPQVRQEPLAQQEPRGPRVQPALPGPSLLPHTTSRHRPLPGRLPEE